ncbi:unnamed protein product [Didymodactylos carnosus]|uniref:Uncharacterized protein n=1 Tax=Didymodactylos carnosus TaxID=1234261 RepID=A0A816A0U0_9BILA|nr:unnamed protein product [Didymodactylos carnosus]CAF4460271.1 unnamed protein product [Didymodactylos carnosus]
MARKFNKTYSDFEITLALNKLQTTKLIKFIDTVEIEQLPAEQFSFVSKKKSTISATTATTSVPDLNTSEWDKDTSMSLNDSSSLLLPLNTSVWDHNATIRMDLSRASESTIEVATTSLSSLTPRAGQLLTREEALRQMREKGQRAAKKVKPVQKRTSVKQKKNSKAKKLSTIEDGMLCCLIS